MAYIFSSIAKRGSTLGITPNATQEARDWYRNQAQNLASRNVNKSRLLTSKENQTSLLTADSIGKMYMFAYDPKTKDKLPFYDTFPLVFPIELYSDGFLGINLHYLPPKLRATLMDALYTTASNNKYDDTTKLKISYELLKGASRFKYFEPCIKRYLWGHVGGNFVNVQTENWDSALLLPTERFVGANKQTVWNNSAKKVS